MNGKEVDVPNGPEVVYLARFTTTDPPYHEVEQADCKFAALTEFRGLPPAELELLRRAYQVIMGG